MKLVGNLLAISIIKDEATESGIIVEDNSMVKKGKVLDVGKGNYSDSGELIPMTVKKGDIVLFKHYEELNKHAVITPETEILAIIK